MDFATRRLSAADRRILARVQLAPDLPAHIVGRAVKQKPATVSYSIRKLKDRGIIYRRAFINSYRLGYQDVSIFFSLVDQSQKQRQQLLARLVRHSHVVFLGTLLGDFHFIVVLLCRNLAEIHGLIEELFGAGADVFSEKLIAPRTSIVQYPRKYLDPGVPPDGSFLLGMDGPAVETDELDRRILSRIGNQGIDSLRQLARTVRAPVSTVERRLRQLESSGVVRGFYYSIDEKALGVQCFRLLIMTKGVCVGTQQRLREFCAAHSRVTYLVHSIGSWDFEIGVEVDDSDQVNSIVEELYGVCGMRIAWVKVLMEGKTLKCSHYPFEAE